jgi:hypothetical protein
MAISDFAKTAKHGRIVLTDGTGTPVSLSVAYDKGDVAFSGLAGEDLNESVDIEARGAYISTAAGARRYPQVTFTAYLTGEGASAPGSVQAFLLKQAPYTANISTLGSGRRYAVNFRLIVEGTDFGDAADWDTVFHDCVPIDTSFSESMDGDSFSFTLSCKGEITGSLALDEAA